MSNYTKWVACWGNATSITDQTATTYTKNLTLRYPIRTCFDGSKLRFHFSNVTGTEPVTIHAFVANLKSGNQIEEASSKPITVDGKPAFTIAPGAERVSDEISFEVTAGNFIAVSMYLEGYTQLNAGTLITGCLSKGYYSYGNFATESILPLELTRSTNWFYFLNTVDVLTEEKNHAIICYGDSITAQDWPDELAVRAFDEGYRNVSIIRRAVSGTRILRQYDCITYACYGLKGETRFPIEVNTAGADTIILQHGINDIIHPVGTDVNVFRPWSDMPTAKDMEDAFTNLYINPAKARGMKVWVGTLLPIYGWRTYEPMREDLKNEFNDWLRGIATGSSPLVDGCIDFDKAVRDQDDPRRFGEGFDSGDHLHPSLSAYRAMAYAVPTDLLI